MFLMLKTVSIIFLSAMMLFSSDQKQMLVLCSFYPMYIMTKNITDGVKGINVQNMTKPQTGCLHDYQLTPNDMKKLTTASILIVNGGGMESFLDRTIKPNHHLKIIAAGKDLEFITENHCFHEHDNDHKNAHINPHIWVAVSGAIAQVKNICEGMVLLDPSNSEKYRNNSQNYIKKLEELKKRMDDGLSGISNRNIITFHEAFSYFAKEFNLNVLAVIEREPGSEPGAGELAELIRIVKEKNVKVIFTEPQYSAKSAETIAKETGVRLYQLDPAVSGPDDLNSYISIMDSNLDVLREALH